MTQNSSHVTAELAAAYADRELEPASALEVERHVGECPTCQDSLRLQRAVRDRLSQEPAAGVPIALRDRVFAAVRAAPVPEGIGTPERSGAQERASARWRRRPIIGVLTRHPAWSIAAVLAVITVVSYSWERLGIGRDQGPVERPGGVAGARSDSAAVVQLIRNHAIAWNDRNPKAAADLVTTDAVWVTSTGAELRGREAIERAHAQWLAEDAAGGGTTTHVHRPESIEVRFLRPDVAVADLEGQFFLPASVEEQPAVVEEARIFIVATWDGKAWRISQLRNMKRQAVGPTQR
ncbi:MAG TPA: SgcJ/EcaC family oxidoreductase [Longimicrobiales bacterium]